MSKKRTTNNWSHNKFLRTVALDSEQVLGSSVSRLCSKQQFCITFILDNSRQTNWFVACVDKNTTRSWFVVFTREKMKGKNKYFFFLRFSFMVLKKKILLGFGKKTLNNLKCQRKKGNLFSFFLFFLFFCF